MTDEGRSSRSTHPGLINTVSPRPVLMMSVSQLMALALLLTAFAGCGLRSERRGVPPEVEMVIGTVTDDIAAERYEKIYNEAADLWKEESSLEKSVADFRTLSAKLGKTETRTLHSATEQYNSGGPLKGNAFILSYQTRFEKGEGMETFTLVQRDRQWQLARYFVNSTALK